MSDEKELDEDALLDLDTPEHVVDAELQRMGLDPAEVRARGARFVESLRFKLLGLSCVQTQTRLTTIECDVDTTYPRFDLAVLDADDMGITLYRNTTVPALYAYGMGTLRASLRACMRDGESYTIFLRRNLAEDIREAVAPERVVALRFYEALPPKTKAKTI